MARPGLSESQCVQALRLELGSGADATSESGAPDGASHSALFPKAMVRDRKPS